MADLATLYTLTFTRPHQPALRFMFRDEPAVRGHLETAVAERSKRTDAMYRIADDFGNFGAIDLAAIDGIVLADVARDLEGNGEAGLIQARMNAVLQRRAQADPAINGGVVQARSFIPPGHG